MTLGKNVRILRLISGEMIVSELNMDDEGMYLLDYPALIIPIPPQQAGGQQGQIGFAKFMPFSDYSEDIMLSPHSVCSDTIPHQQIIQAYEEWSKQTRGQDSGIIVPNMRPPTNVPKTGQAGPNFKDGLNIG